MSTVQTLDLKPFPVDPQVMAAIRPMDLRDISRVVALHQAAMGSSLWARLGTPFLMTLYRGMLAHPDFIGFVYEEDSRVRGFIAGSTDTRRLFRWVLFRAGPQLIAPTLQGLAHNLPLLRELVQTPLYFSRSSAPAETIPAESLFCSFEPDLRGKRISGHINKVLFDELRARGQQQVKITTETDNEGANRQLRSWGFEDRGTFRFYGKEMRVFVLDLLTSPRVEAVRRHRIDPRLAG